MHSLIAKLPSPVGNYVKLNNDDIIVDTYLNASGYSDGSIHATFTLNGDRTFACLQGTETINGIVDDLLRAKYQALS